MVRRGFFWFRLLAALILVAGLIAAGSAIYRAGQMQGYALGLAQAGGDQLPGQGANPYLPVYPGYGPYWQPVVGFSTFGMLLGLFFWGGLLFLFFGMLRAFFWRRHGYGAYDWHGGWRGSHPWAARDPQPGRSGRDPAAPDVM